MPLWNKQTRKKVVFVRGKNPVQRGKKELLSERGVHIETAEPAAVKFVGGLVKRK